MVERGGKEVKQTNNIWLRLARLLAFILAIALSILAIYTYIASAIMVIRNPALILPGGSIWNIQQLHQALAGLGLPVNFYAFFALGLNLIFSLVFIASGWLILFRKNQDWYSLYLALLLLGWAHGYGTSISMPEVSTWVTAVEPYFAWLLWPGLFSLLYLFPSGHIIPRWTRWFLYILGFFVAYGLIITIFNIPIANFLYALPFIFTVLIVGAYAQYYRYRHVGQLERQQIKWVVLALILFVIFFIGFALLINVAGLGDSIKFSLTIALIFQIISFVFNTIAFMGIPISIALAMLRYRLWDVDIVIRRTLVYGALTLILALVFFVGVTLLQALFVTITHQKSAISIIVSTLAIYVLFNPLRIRIQNTIDRRFFRSKYDAQKMLERFAAAARNEVELEQLTVHLLDVVNETIQPQQASLWLRPVQKPVRSEE